SPVGAEGTLFTLQLSAGASEGGASAVATTSLAVSVGDSAEAPLLTASGVGLAEVPGAALTIGLGLAERAYDGDDTLAAVTLTGVPAGWSLVGDGAASLGSGVWSAGAGSLAALTLVSPVGAEGTLFTLQLSAGASEGGASAVATTSLAVSVGDSAEAPTFTGGTVFSGGVSVSLANLTVTGDADDALSATIAGLSAGWTLVDTHSPASSFTGSPITAIPVSDLGSLVVVAPELADAATDLLTLTVISSEGVSTASAGETLTVTATQQAEPPSFSGPSGFAFYGSETVTLTPLGASAVAGDTLASNATITGLSSGWTLVDTHSPASSFTGSSITAIPVSDLGSLVVVVPTGTNFSLRDLLTLTVSSSLGGSTTSGSEVLALVAQAYTSLSGSQVDANLTNADLTGANIRLVDLTGATLTGATLTNADLTGATLVNANLSGANLSGATLHNATGGGVDLSGADLTGADLHNANLTSATLTGADLSGTNFGSGTGSATLTGTTFPLQLSLLGASAGGHDVTGAVTDGFIGTITINAVDNGTTLGALSISYSSATAPEAWSIGNVTFAQGDTITVTARDSEGVFYSASGTVVATVPAGVAGSPINLALPDPAGGGMIAVTIAGIPAGWSLNAGTDLGDGSWSVESSNPSSLAITPSGDFVGAVVLPVSESWIGPDGRQTSAFVGDNVEAYAPGNPVFALSGTDTLTGSGANDLFVFARPIGRDRIYGFNPASSRVDLIGFSGISSFADLQSRMANDANGNAVLTLGSGETITIEGVAVASLGAANFVFNGAPTTRNAGSMTIGDGATLPLGGSIDNTGTIALNSTGAGTELVVLSDGVTLEGGGRIALSDNTANAIVDSGFGATLTNRDNTITGAGRIGDAAMMLRNGGVIDATGVDPLILDTGRNSISNSGLIEATGPGGLVIGSAIVNSGALRADAGTLSVDGAATGSGVATIAATATLEFAGASAENTDFADGAAGILKLDHSAAFTGAISGFAGGDAIDLTDLAFESQTALSYTGNGAGGGTLRVDNGTQAIDLALLGQYAAAGFQAHRDPGGGTLITYSPQTSAAEATSLTNLSH
ncbi:MAG TPA: pentapeptide repeat-containing protein, partial [Stellaceae bacterium]|nr:pentapeptide repeat-containing protein [Stellaceae bacterium]